MILVSCAYVRNHSSFITNETCEISLNNKVVYNEEQAVLSVISEMKIYDSYGKYNALLDTANKHIADDDIETALQFLDDWIKEIAAGGLAFTYEIRDLKNGN